MKKKKQIVVEVDAWAEVKAKAEREGKNASELGGELIKSAIKKAKQ